MIGRGADLDDFVRGIPKAELHLHVEGTLEPEMACRMAERHGVRLPYASPDALRRAYDFVGLPSFLDVYYAVAEVLRDERDFYELTRAYLERAHADGVVHAEVFFDPQTHTGRGVPIGAVIHGIHGALASGARDFGMTSRLMLCFLRHLSEEAALATLTEAMPYRDRIAAVGLDSAEANHPPAKFARVFAMARAAGFRVVAHAGEDGPAAYVREALDVLGVARVDHGVRSEEDDDLCARLVREGVALTVCPLSNVKLRIFPTLAEHNLKRLLDRGLCVTISSDDPAYFGGYVAENYRAAVRELGLGRDDVMRLAKNSFTASFLEPAEKADWHARIDAYVRDHAPASASRLGR
jgi:adenine deaminase